ncbi:MAG: quinol dehydrogenase ferredoxin subunit NapH [Magnetococcales bacterium]|nr:quinol dehydrogenase ferredoxin subunit NapH [Magnetococcales bacterium]
MKTYPGDDALRLKGRLLGRKWLLLRRLSQLLVMTAFWSGPWWGVWIAKGNLSSSLLLDTVPMTDVLTFLQVLASGIRPEAQAVWGFAGAVGVYALLGGRTFCAWACPVNPVTDAAAWLRGRLGIGRVLSLPRWSRYVVLAVALALAALTGSQAWELINPMSAVHRGLIFGMGLGWWMVLALFLFDLLLAKEGWCGRLCPNGAAYSLLSPVALVRVEAHRREACDDCMDCFLVCPEPQVIAPALKSGPEGSPMIRGWQCTHCGRCIDVCSKDVYRFSWTLANGSKVAS